MRAVAHLTIIILFPAHDPAARGQRTGVTPSSSNGADPARQAAHIYRREALRVSIAGCSIAQLSPSVVSPALDPAAHRQCTGVAITGGDSGDVEKRRLCLKTGNGLYNSWSGYSD